MGITVPDHVHARLIEMGQASGITPAQAARILLTNAITERAHTPDMALLNAPDVEALLTRLPDGSGYQVAELLTEGFSVPEVEAAFKGTDQA